ncbi:hypothetical protein GCM10008995_27480 [Halobellus salinus]|uniref:Uncharacterized protein n=1 Tax=Halobellus salinus TaxID=931585 RepID=A0A830EL46_9EURY|nr:hypothetical protein GCM10008995_27480 [Halobellus salinus]SMP31396.1 hypothetical protein SAMN06265347_11823 [Halobellus salinus]
MVACVFRPYFTALTQRVVIVSHWDAALDAVEETPNGIYECSGLRPHDDRPCLAGLEVTDDSHYELRM